MFVSTRDSLAFLICIFTPPPPLLSLLSHSHISGSLLLSQWGWRWRREDGEGKSDGFLWPLGFYVRSAGLKVLMTHVHTHSLVSFCALTQHATCSVTNTCYKLHHSCVFGECSYCCDPYLRCESLSWNVARLSWIHLSGCSFLFCRVKTTRKSLKFKFFLMATRGR